MTHLRALARHNRRVQIMGIVNRTPDSFFDGGSYLEDGAARARVELLVRLGADIIDVGAESTRPGAPQVHPHEQIDRIGDAIAWVVAGGAIASVDTTSADVAAHAVKHGARMINSVSLDNAAALGRIAATCAEPVDLVLTHCRGEMTAMRGFSDYDDAAYDDVVDDVAREWRAAAECALEAGLPAERLVFDPGLGFTKNARQSLLLCARLAELKQKVGGHRVLVGTSRKSYVAQTVAAALDIEPPEPQDRLGGTIAATVACVQAGADIVRVHDVAPVRQALAYAAEVARV